MAVILAVLFTAFWCYANYSGRPGLFRLNEETPFRGANVTKHVVYGWPIATSQELETANASGGGASSSTRNAGDAIVVNVALFVILLLFLIFLTDWIAESRWRAQTLSGQMTEVLRSRLEDRRQAFRRRWWGVARVLLALFVASIGLLIVYGCFMGMRWRAEDATSPYAEVVNTIQRKGASSRTVRGGGGYVNAALAIGMLVGTLFVFGGVVLIVRRFRLWMALAALLFVGLMGSLPFLYGPQAQSGKALISFGFERPLSETQLDTIRGLLKPEAAEKTLPESVRREMPPKLGLLDVQVDSKAEDGGAGIRVVLEFDPRLSYETRATVFAMYYEYVYQTVSRAAKAQGMPTLGGEGGVGVGSSTWPRLRNEWIEARKPELDALFQP